MTKSAHKEAIDALTTVLEEKIRQYLVCVKNDDILEVKKQLRVQIREIENKIVELEILVCGQAPDRKQAFK
ncbi:MAG: hypothetical protein JWM28_1813 [Chitinophagaceae bacterium]|nr:hypothetical protein [Chitinophagaceae bacterium]